MKDGEITSTDNEINFERLLDDKPHDVLIIKKKMINDEGNESQQEIKVYKFKHNQELPVDLPQGYCFIGGTARSIVLKEMEGISLPARDTDIVAIDDLSPDKSQLTELSERHMAEDYSHGHGIKVEKFNLYFTTRDFTINEVLIHGDTVFATEQALLDLHHKTIRPSEYERDKWKSYNERRNGVTPKLAMKALRLHGEFEEMYSDAEIDGIEEWQWKFENISVFFIALQLERAFERGDATAHKFYLQLLKMGIVAKQENDRNEIKAKDAKDLALNIRFFMLESGRDPFIFTRKDLNKYPDKRTDYEKYADLANMYGDKLHHTLRRSKNIEEL